MSAMSERQKLSERGNARAAGCCLVTEFVSLVAGILYISIYVIYVYIYTLGFFEVVIKSWLDRGLYLHLLNSVQII